MPPKNPYQAAFANLATKLKQSSISQAATRDKWFSGDLSWKMWDVQKRMKEIIDSPLDSSSVKKVLECSRRLRKTSTILLKVLETGISKNKALMRGAFPTRDQMISVLFPLMDVLLEDCPEELKPMWESQRHQYFFPKSEAILSASGCDTLRMIGRLRGSAADLCFVDEAQDVVHLKYLVDDVLMPQLLGVDRVRGPLIMAFTPPKVLDHQCLTYAASAEMAGTYAKYTIYDGGYKPEIIDIFAKEAGGKDSTSFRREYLCEHIVDDDYSIIPEWKDKFVGTYEPDQYYEFYHKYEGMDIGVQDLTINLFAVYDFLKAKLYILDEVCMNGNKMTTKKLADEISEKEINLWGKMPIKSRVSDNNNLILLQDLGTLHGIDFAPTQKDTLEAMVNNLRLWISAGRIIVDPNCVQLLGSLKYGVWDDKRKDWERSQTFGHFDALAALMYLVRYVDTQTNPIPPNFGYNPDTQFLFKPDQTRLTDNEQAIVRAFFPRKR